MSLANKAIFANIEAKPERVAEVEALLKGALELAKLEMATTTWFAFKLNDTRFGIFDTFINNEGRQAHLEGEIAKALMGRADELLAKAPEIMLADVIAAKLP